MDSKYHFGRARVKPVTAVNGYGQHKNDDGVCVPSRTVARTDFPPPDMRSTPKTFDEAVSQLRHVPQGCDRRFYALRKGFEPREVPEHGIGLFAVEITTGKVCEFLGRWTSEGDLLICERCFEDGT